VLSKLFMRFSANSIFQELMEGTTQHEYAHIVDLTTQNALKSMLGPTLLTIPVSIVLGFMFVPCP